MTDWITKKRPLVIVFSFCLYTLFSVYYFHTVGFTLLGPKSGKALQDVTAASLMVCFLLLLTESCIRRTWEKSAQEEWPSSREHFLPETVVSGFFFAAGSFFCLKGMIAYEIIDIWMNDFGIENAYASVHLAPFSWSQICIFVFLLVSVIGFCLFFRFDKEAFFSFFGYILTLTGLLSLYIWAEAFQWSGWLDLSYVFLIGSKKAAPVTFFILAGVFLMVCLKVNRSLPLVLCCGRVWLQTLFFSCLTAVAGVIFSALYFSREVLFYCAFHYESVFLFGGFLFFCLQCYRQVLPYTNRLGGTGIFLKHWAAGILLLNAALFAVFHKDLSFLIRSTLLCVGIYCIWNPAVALPAASVRSRVAEAAALLLLGFLLAGGATETFMKLILNGLWLQDTLLWQYIVFYQEHKALCVLFMSLPVTAWFMKWYSWEKAVNSMCRGIVLCLMAWLATDFVQYVVTHVFLAIAHVGKAGWWQEASSETRGMWYGVSLMLSSVFSLILSVWQCKKGIGRIIVWTVLSNLLLYQAIGSFIWVGVGELLELRNLREWLGVESLAWNVLFKGILPILTMGALLALSGLFIWFAKLEQSVFPKLLKCRVPRDKEREKLAEITILLEKAGIPASVYRILVCQSRECRAFSVGRSTVAVTQVFLEDFPAPHVAGVLAHELGHVRNRDGYYSFIIDALNLPVFFISRIGSALLKGQKKTAAFALPVFFFIIFSGFFSGIQFVMSWIIFYCLLQTAIQIIRKQDFRESEFAADSFASGHGLGQELKTALLQIGVQKESLSLWELIMSDYPDFPERIKRLDALT